MNIQNKIKLLTQSVFGNERTAFEARYALLSVLAKKISVRLYNKDYIWPNDREFQSVWYDFPSYGNAEIHERRFNLYYLSKSVKNVPGDTAECGVFEGAGSHIILKSNVGVDKKHYIFDSFEGLSQIEDNDFVESSKTLQWCENDLAIAENVVHDNLKSFNNIVYFKGWIPDRFHEVAKKRFSFVHIDVDLYQPTLDSIGFFYEKMACGGMMVCDDYGSKRCPGAYSAMNDFFKDKSESIIHLTTGQGVVIKQA